MATYFLRAKHLSREQGRSRAEPPPIARGECIRDELTSEVYYYADRRDVVYKEIVLQAQLAGRA